MDFQREQILKNALEDKDVKALVEHNQISEEILNKEILSIYSYMINKKKCAGCSSLNNCQQDIIGSMPKINYNGNIYTEYVPCPYFQKEMDSNEKIANLLTLACNLDSIDSTSLFSDKPARKLIYNKMVNIYNTTMNGEYVKGIYLHGNFGCGKTYLIAAIFNELAKNNYKSSIIFWPEFLRQAFYDDFNAKFEYVKKVPLLLIDDIGAEGLTAWNRDEILCPLLQYRMDNNLTTFFTSNLTLKELESHLSNSKNGVDEVKAKRIISRMQQLTEDLEMISKNLRN